MQQFQMVIKCLCYKFLSSVREFSDEFLSAVDFCCRSSWSIRSFARKTWMQTLATNASFSHHTHIHGDKITGQY